MTTEQMERVREMAADCHVGRHGDGIYTADGCLVSPFEVQQMAAALAAREAEVAGLRAKLTEWRTAQHEEARAESELMALRRHGWRDDSRAYHEEDARLLGLLCDARRRHEVAFRAVTDMADAVPPQPAPDTEACR